VVGVILNLALFFGYHLLWPQGFAGSFDAVSAAIAIAAGVALFKYQAQRDAGDCCVRPSGACAQRLESRLKIMKLLISRQG